MRMIMATATAAFMLGCVAVTAPSPSGSVPPPVVTSAPATPPGATGSAGPSLTASTQPTPRPAPTGEAAEVISAFIEEFALAQPPFHVDSDIEFTASSGTQTETGSVRIEGDISGENFDGEVEIPGEERALIRLVDGLAYGRPAGGEWEVIPDFVQTQPLNPFSRLDPADVQYIGTSEIDGRSLHQLRTDQWIGGELEAEGVSDIRLLSNVFDVYVTTAGNPVEAVLDFSISGRVAGYAVPVEIDYHVLYGFSRVGKPVDIRAPL